MSGLRSLLKSRKFWLAVVGLGGVIITETFGSNPEAIEGLSKAIIVIIGILISAIAVEDSAGKLAR